MESSPLGVEGRGLRIALLLLLLLSLLPYLNALQNGFVWDDRTAVVENPNVREWRGLRMFLLEPSAVEDPVLAREIYRPLRTLSFFLDHLFWGLNPFGYHLANVLLHALCVLLLFTLVLALAGRRAVALLAGAVFALHPVHTENVDWVSGRSDLLCLLFLLFSLLLYIRWRATRKRGLLLAASLLSFFLSLLSKEQAIVLPLLVFFVEICAPEGRGKPLPGRALGECLPYLIVSLLYLALRWGVLGQLAQKAHWGGGMAPTLLTIPSWITAYVRLLLLPAPLCSDYLLFPLQHFPSAAGFLLPALFLVALLLLALLLLRRIPLAALALLWFFLTLLPVLNLVPTKIPIAERFLYIPSVGFALGLALWFSSFGGRQKRPALFAAGGCLLFFALLTIHRNPVWRDEGSLSAGVLKVFPRNARAHQGIGVALLGRGEREKARAHFLEAIRIAPNFRLPHLALARMAESAGATRKHLERALEIDPSDWRCAYWLADSHLMEGDYAGAIPYLESVAKENRRFPTIFSILGEAYARAGRTREARESYRKALQMDPVSGRARAGLASLDAPVEAKSDALTPR